jgi:SAM-dependent methyltransferase
MNRRRLPEPRVLDSWLEERAIMARHIRELGTRTSPLNILEAGCGTTWGLDLEDVPYTLTGVDIDPHALKVRLRHEKDLHFAICGDLRTLELTENAYDVIFNSYVLEHVSGARQVLNNFVHWLKPGGIIVLVIPNRDSVWGFVTRFTPFRFHVFFRKYVTGDRNAGTPGYAPYPTHYDKVVSRDGVYRFCEENGLVVTAEYSVGHGRRNKGLVAHACVQMCTHLVHLASFGALSAKHANLIYIIEKPAVQCELASRSAGRAIPASASR